jgi:two-component system CheB/CheR fusion protein
MRERSREQDFFIAGIGASAGGHDALKQFFDNLPPNPGVAFCVITHLIRDHKSILDKIISRHTDLKVVRMKGADVVKPNHIYVMPENAKAYIKNGSVYLRERTATEVINKTVDEFLYSLAEDQKERAIAIIFSGMGDDGSRGVDVIHEFGGIVLVQDPQSTAFKSMPEHAIKRDDPDQILPPALLARTLMDQIRVKQFS